MKSSKKKVKDWERGSNGTREKGGIEEGERLNGGSGGGGEG